MITTVGEQRSKEEAGRNSRWAEKGAVCCRKPVTEKWYGDQGTLAAAFNLSGCQSLWKVLQMIYIIQRRVKYWF